MMSPLVSLLTTWERRRGTGQIMGLIDMHYSSAVRYHFFLGYRRYKKDQTPWAKNQPMTAIQPSLAKKSFK